MNPCSIAMFCQRNMPVIYYILHYNDVLFCMSNVYQAINADIQRYRYVWIIPGTYGDGWLKENITQTNFDFDCLHTTTEIEAFVYNQRVITISHYPQARQNETNIEILTNRVS